jgi:hypothetical protein
MKAPGPMGPLTQDAEVVMMRKETRTCVYRTFFVRKVMTSS